MDSLDIIKINNAVELRIFKGEYERPIELTSDNEFVNFSLLFNRDDMIKLVAVLTQHLEGSNNGN